MFRKRRSGAPRAGRTSLAQTLELSPGYTRWLSFDSSSSTNSPTRASLRSRAGDARGLLIASGGVSGVGALREAVGTLASDVGWLHQGNQAARCAARTTSQQILSTHDAQERSVLRRLGSCCRVPAACEPLQCCLSSASVPAVTGRRREHGGRSQIVARRAREAPRASGVGERVRVRPPPRRWSRGKIDLCATKIGRMIGRMIAVVMVSSSSVLGKLPHMVQLGAVGLGRVARTRGLLTPLQGRTSVRQAISAAVWHAHS